MTEPIQSADMEALEETETDTVEDPAAEIAKWKALSRKHEKAAKESRAALKDIEVNRQTQMTDVERATAEAEAKGRQAAKVEYAERLAASEIRAALVGIVEDPDQIIEDLNIAKYVDEDGDVDTDAIVKLRDKYKRLMKKPIPSTGHGRESHASSGQTDGEVFASFLRQQMGN